MNVQISLEAVLAFKQGQLQAEVAAAAKWQQRIDEMIAYRDEALKQVEDRALEIQQIEGKIHHEKTTSSTCVMYNFAGLRCRG